MEYTWAAVAAVVIVVLLEVAVLRTGIFRTTTFWISYGIVVFFQVLVDGWLTKLSSPIVIYDPDQFSGRRAPFDIPVEDYLFGFAMITLTILLWVKIGPRAGDGNPGDGNPGDGPTGPGGRGWPGGGPTTRTGTAPTRRR